MMKHLTAERAEGAEKRMVKAQYRSLPYVAPFVVFLFFLAIKAYVPFEYPIRVVAVTAVLLIFSRRVISLRPARPAASILVGVIVFAVWIGPDLLWPAYRQHWLFHNSLLGSPRSSLPADLRVDPVFLIFRVIGTALLVPVVEELFWRAWLMRYLISPDFRNVRLGAYTAMSFWLTALLFASEHGPYWDVGLLAGIAYGWWMIRTRSLADCIIAHAVTNLALGVSVVVLARWEYWL